MQLNLSADEGHLTSYKKRQRGIDISSTENSFPIKSEKLSDSEVDTDSSTSTSLKKDASSHVWWGSESSFMPTTKRIRLLDSTEEPDLKKEKEGNRRSI